MAYLLTQSLISSWNYMFNCYESRQESAYNDFLAALNREKKETTPEMQNGIDFENEVYSMAAGNKEIKHPQWENGIRCLSERLRGSVTQVKASRDLFCHEKEIVLYGILDALHAGHIYDVKFLNKSFGSSELAGKYLESPQHPAYLYLVPEAVYFTYLVSDGNDLYTETYTRRNTRPIQDIAEEFYSSIESMGLMPIYEEKWLAR